MNSKTTKKSDTEVTLTVTADGTYLQPVKDAIVSRLGSKLKIQGFREGKAPATLVEKSLDQNVLQTEFLEESINRLYIDSVKEQQLNPILPPKVTIKKFVPFTELEFEAEVEVIGEIKLPDYTTIKKIKPTAKVVDKDVSDVLKNLQIRAADKKDVDRAAAEGDQLWIDFKGTNEKGEPVQGAEGKDYPLVLGSKTFIPGFEDNLLGAKAGNTKTFTLTFPKDYGVKALANKNVAFDITVNKVQEVVKPELDDAFAAKIGPFKTLQELKDDIKKQLLQEQQFKLDRQFEEELVKEVAAKAKVSVPKSLVDEQLDRAEQEERQNLAYRGQTWQEHLAEEGVTEEEHRENNRPKAEERVKVGLVLSEVADKEKVTVTPEELEVRIQLLKGQYQDSAMQAELDKPENRREIANRILTEKTLDKIVSYATRNRQ